MVKKIMLSGYQHPNYCHSLSEFGSPFALPCSGSWILKRPIANSAWHDAMGCYPLFTCVEWSQLAADLAQLEDDLITLTVITDPFGDYDLNHLEVCFKDVIRPFKRHFVIDLHQPRSSYVSKHHRRNASKALHAVDVERCPEPLLLLDDWINLYAALIDRHGITGIQGFSRLSFAQQLQIPGLVAFRAVLDESTVAMLLWYIQGDVVYYHLGASNSAGYEARASFALFWTAIEYFTTQGLRWLNLGAGAGIEEDLEDGLTRFKRGWASDTRIAYLCGRIFNRPVYEQLTADHGEPDSNYFPAYRTPPISSETT